MVVKEGARAVTYLSLFGYPVDGVVVNRVLPGVESDGKGRGMGCHAKPRSLFATTCRRFRRVIWAEIERDFYPLPILRSGWFDQEMVGLTALEQLARTLIWRARPWRGDVCGADADGGRRRQ